MSVDGPAFWTPHMIAKRWGVTAETVRACIRAGKLAAFRVGPRLYRVSADRLVEFEAQRTAEAARPKGPPPLTPEEREAERERDADMRWWLRMEKMKDKWRLEAKESAERERKEADLRARLIDSVSRGGWD